MPVGEIYIKLIVGFPRDPKVRALVRYGADAGLARDLYVQMCLYCKENLTDGYVPAEEVGVLAYPLPIDQANQLAKQLASVGLIKEVSNGEAQGWHVLGYLKRNGSKQDVERLSQVRAEAGRKGGRPPAKPAGRPAKPAGQKPARASGNQIGKQNESRPNPYTETESETESSKTLPAQDPPAPAEPAEPTLTQRSKRLTDAYAEAEPMCKWPAVNGVVLSAIKSGRFADEEIRAALLRLAAEGRSVTIDSLRTELAGFPPRIGRGHSPEPVSAADQRRADVTRLREIDRQQREGQLPPGTIQGSVIA